MVRLRPLAAALPLVLLLGCGPRPQPPAPSRSVPQVSAPRSEQADSAAEDPSRDPQALRPRIALPASDVALQTIAVNLDADPEEEQLIAVKNRTELEAPVRVVVADIDPAQGQYWFQSWESETNATNARLLDLTVSDLVGDHSRTIVVSGMNREGRLTLDVFRASAPITGRGLTFRPVCQIVADEIRVEASPRDEAYTESMRNGPSFPIVAFLRDPESANVMDLVRITYTWRYAENRYAPGPPEKIPGERIEQKQLEKLFTSGTPPAFEEFLAGSWAQLTAGTTAEARVTAIVDFQPRARRISISTGDTQEVYRWRDTLRTIYNRVILIGENEAVAKITKTFSVSVESVTSLQLSVQGSDLGDYPLATYTRVSEELQERLLARSGRPVLVDKSPFGGSWSGAADLVLDFDNPRIAWTEGGRRLDGSYVVYSLQGRTILSVRLPAGRPGGSRAASYLADSREKREASRIVRTLTLTPVQLTVRGFEESVGPMLTLVQTQDLQKP